MKNFLNRGSAGLFKRTNGLIAEGIQSRFFKGVLSLIFEVIFRKIVKKILETMIFLEKFLQEFSMQFSEKSPAVFLVALL